MENHLYCSMTTLPCCSDFKAILFATKEILSITRGNTAVTPTLPDEDIVYCMIIYYTVCVFPGNVNSHPKKGKRTYSEI